MNTEKYYIVRADVLPKTFAKVMEAKSLLASGEVKTAGKAASAVGISRSVFYKYKDAISSFEDKNFERTITLTGKLKDKAGVLSAVIASLSENGANIITINQSVPKDMQASFTISMKTASLRVELEKLIDDVNNIDGVIDIDILSGE